MSSRKRRRYCEHCDDIVSKRTYKEHKADFFDVETKKWKKRVTQCEDSDPEDKIIIGEHGHKSLQGNSYQQILAKVNFPNFIESSIQIEHLTYEELQCMNGHQYA